MNKPEVTVEVKVEAVVHGPDALFFRMDCGKATDATGREFELSYAMGAGTPIIRLPDGRWVTFGWQALLIAAMDAGVEANG